MSPFLDYALVLLAVAAATAYLIYRKVRTARRIARDWATGSAENCGSCPVIEIKRRQVNRAASPPSK